MNNNIYVIGSGPSGMACAYTLLKAGHKVTLLDVGFTIEKESADIVNSYRKHLNKDELIRSIQDIRKRSSKQSDLQQPKALFGSDYPYKIIDDTYMEIDKNAVIRSSLAKGGFSTVWGANVCSIIPKEMNAWPITFDDLKPYYSMLEDIVDISSPKDEMSEIFPVNIGQPPTFPLGKQGNDLYNSLYTCKQKLIDDGIYFGRAKLSIGPKYSLDSKGCTPCGLCMYGCPNNAIFNSAFVLDTFKQYDNFTYLSDKLVTSFSEKKEEVTIYIKDINTKVTSTLKCNRLFLACGAINSTSIVARSLHLTDHEFIIKDNQKYHFPLIRWHRSKGCIYEKANTADQIFMEIDNPSVSRNIVHLQYYGYNDLIFEPIRQRLGPITEFLPKLFAGFFERLMICFVYFHSDDSGTMSLKVRDFNSGNKTMGEIKGQINPESKTMMKSLLHLLRKHHHGLGGIPLEFGVQTTLPGYGQHIGCTIPMSKTPNTYQTDCLGRPSGCNLVHVVDSSILPSVPATPLTLTVMANACRIADSVNKEIPDVSNV